MSGKPVERKRDKYACEETYTGTLEIDVMADMCRWMDDTFWNDVIEILR